MRAMLDSGGIVLAVLNALQARTYTSFRESHFATTYALLALRSANHIQPLVIPLLRLVRGRWCSRLIRNRLERLPKVVHVLCLIRFRFRQLYALLHLIR